MHYPRNRGLATTNNVRDNGPSILDLSTQITQHDMHPSANAYGGYTNVWDGIWRTEGEPRKVCYLFHVAMILKDSLQVAIKSFRGRIANSEVEKKVMMVDFSSRQVHVANR